jgi:hypothetical protein
LLLLLVPDPLLYFLLSTTSLPWRAPPCGRPGSADIRSKILSWSKKYSWRRKEGRQDEGRQELLGFWLTLSIHICIKDVYYLYPRGLSCPAVVNGFSQVFA